MTTDTFPEDTPNDDIPDDSTQEPINPDHMVGDEPTEEAQDEGLNGEDLIRVDEQTDEEREDDAKES